MKSYINRRLLASLLVVTAIAGAIFAAAEFKAAEEAGVSGAAAAAPAPAITADHWRMTMETVGGLGITPEQFLGLKDKDGKTMLYYAIQSGDSNAVITLCGYLGLSLDAPPTDEAFNKFFKIVQSPAILAHNMLNFIAQPELVINTTLTIIRLLGFNRHTPEAFARFNRFKDASYGHTFLHSIFIYLNTENIDLRPVITELCTCLGLSLDTPPNNEDFYGVINLRNRNNLNPFDVALDASCSHKLSLRTFIHLCKLLGLDQPTREARNRVYELSTERKADLFLKPLHRIIDIIAADTQNHPEAIVSGFDKDGAIEESAIPYLAQLRYLVRECGFPINTLNRHGYRPLDLLVTNYIDNKHDALNRNPGIRLREGVIRYLASIAPGNEEHGCIICSEAYTSKDNAQPFDSAAHYNVTLLLPCHHHFHTTCITQWRTRDNSCPTCRKTPIPDYFNLIIRNFVFDDQRWMHPDIRRQAAPNGRGYCLSSTHIAANDQAEFEKKTRQADTHHKRGGAEGAAASDESGSSDGTDSSGRRVRHRAGGGGDAAYESASDTNMGGGGSGGGGGG